MANPVLIAALLLSLTAIGKPKNGYVTERDDIGNEIGKFTYVNGVKNGPFETRDNSANTVKGNYVNGKIEGIVKTYGFDGDKESLVSTETYKNDVREGPAKFYGDNNKLAKEGSFKDNQEVGKWKEYFLDGSFEVKDYGNGDPNRYIPTKTTWSMNGLKDKCHEQSGDFATLTSVAVNAYHYSLHTNEDSYVVLVKGPWRKKDLRVLARDRASCEKAASVSRSVANQR